VWAVAVLGLAGGTAAAQPPYSPAGQPTGPVTRPTFSPYMNLLRSSNSPGVNYYGLVRPQVQAHRAISELQSAVTRPAVTPFDTADPGLPVTGQTFGYMTHSRYFMNNQAGGAGGSWGNVVGGRIGGAAAGPSVGGMRR
jgi:hypothetical protein